MKSEWVTFVYGCPECGGHIDVNVCQLCRKEYDPNYLKGWHDAIEKQNNKIPLRFSIRGNDMETTSRGEGLDTFLVVTEKLKESKLVGFNWKIVIYSKAQMTRVESEKK